jgi:nucleoside 2-deoxyribosyltransferase
MKIAICASMSAAQTVLKVKSELVDLGHEVVIPATAKIAAEQGLEAYETATAKVHGNLIRGYFSQIEQADAVLIVNEHKNGIDDYIGGNTLIELAFGFVLNKRCFIYNDIPQLSYTDEIMAMAPMVLQGDLSKLV